METINEYLYNVYNLIHKNQQSGLLEKPKNFKLCKEDKKVLKIIYSIYKIYKYSLSKKSFYKIVIDYSLSTKNRNIIQSGNEVAELIQKIIKR